MTLGHSTGAVSASHAVSGRLAPSPTGAQHVGNARTYLLAWLSARLQHGRVYLRIEDIDSPRVKPEATEQAIEDLRWLGLDWDPIPSISLGDTDTASPPRSTSRSVSVTTTGQDCDSGSVWVQTHRLAIYAGYLEQLRQSGRLYPCHCTRRDIELAASAPNLGDPKTRYPDTCRQRPVPQDLFSEGLLAVHSAGSPTVPPNVSPVPPAPQRVPFAWRFRCSDQAITLHDGIVGTKIASPHHDEGDFVIARSQSQVAYQLAVTVDDHEMGVSEVVRGDDLIPSTFWQLDLYRAFGWTPPRFFHVPLVVGPDGRRLAKRHGDTRLSEIRNRGLGPERLLGVLAFSCGLTDTPAPIDVASLLGALRDELRTLTGGRDPTETTVVSPDVARRVGNPQETNGDHTESELGAAWQYEPGRMDFFWAKLPRSPWVLTKTTWDFMMWQGGVESLDLPATGR
jgi:glutamyl-tRNA synthetase